MRQSNDNERNKKAYRFWNKTNPVFWVNEVKHPGCDWGYTSDSHKAIYLTPYWQKRFASDCKKAGVKPKFFSCDELKTDGKSKTKEHTP